MMHILTKKWISVMVESDNGSCQLEEKLNYLKENQIRCRISMIGATGKIDDGMVTAVCMRANNEGSRNYMSLDVHCQDVEKAKQLLLNNIFSYVNKNN